MADFSTWIPKQDACDQLGYSYRTLERKIIKLKLRTAQRDVPGRRSIVVIHPDDFQKLKDTTVPATPLPLEENGNGHEVANYSAVPPAVRDLIAALLGTVPYPPKKLFLTVEEAANYAGLPQAEIERLIDS